MSESRDRLDLRACTSTLRSRNAGSFFVTIDAVFRSPDLYDAWRESGLLTSEALSAIFALESSALEVIWFPPASAVKLTLPRRQTAGGPDDHDTDGAQLFVLLLDLAIPTPVAASSTSR